MGVGGTKLRGDGMYTTIPSLIFCVLTNQVCGIATCSAKEGTIICGCGLMAESCMETIRTCQTGPNIMKYALHLRSSLAKDHRIQEPH